MKKRKSIKKSKARKVKDIEGFKEAEINASEQENKDKDKDSENKDKNDENKNNENIYYNI